MSRPIPGKREKIRAVTGWSTTKKMGEETMANAKKSNGRYCVVGNGSWGLYFGLVKAMDEDIAATRSVRLYEARNIRYWYGRKGGITSLVAFGPCGPRVSESRIGAPIASSLLLDVKAVHECSPEAVTAFAAVKCHE